MCFTCVLSIPEDDGTTSNEASRPVWAWVDVVEVDHRPNSKKGKGGPIANDSVASGC